MKKLPEKELLRPDEVADYFSVTRKTVYYWIFTGKLDAYKLCGGSIRIERDAVERAKKSIFE